MRLAPSVIAEGTRLIVLDAAASTNATGLDLARSGERAATWAVARWQTAGRGRRGRAWSSPPGNLYASLMLIDPCAPQAAAQLSFVAAIALHDALASLSLELGFRSRVKWPNDLLVDGMKVAGILVEGETLPDGCFAVVIGIGVNCIHHPGDTPYPATDLAQAGYDLAPAEVLLALSRTLQLRLAEWTGGRNFAAIRAAWLARAAKIGEPIVLRAPTAIEGVFDGVDDEGRLLLRGPDAVVRAFSSADVQFPTPGGST